MTATSATPGRILDGRYELSEPIGQGTFGRVYRGYDRRLDRPVAIKVIKPWWTEEPEWAERFEREAQLMARVSHPGIVQIHDIGHDQGRLFYVAELVEGESLAARLSRGPVPPSQARELAEQLCRALAEAHAQRVVHRDIKPANVLIARSGRVKLGDFGIARLADAGGEVAGTVIGTPGYMAPEQARGRAPTPASDIYSVGVVLSEMLGVQAPPALTAILERALAPEPRDRYADAGEMAAALAAADLPPAELAAADLPPAALAAPGALPRRRPAPTRVRRRLTPRININPSERRRYRALLAAVLLILLAMIAVPVLAANGTVRVPQVRGLSRAAVATKARARHLRVSFSARYDPAPQGTAIAQRPVAGRTSGEGSTLRVLLSAGPRPVVVPPLMGDRSSDAQAILARLKLVAVITPVPAPGMTPGLVVAQSPAAAASRPPHTTVTLSVAEVPRWRPLTSFSGDGAGRSVAFGIRGDRWRVLYSMGWDGTCGLLGLFCSGPSAQVANPSTGATTGQFDLGSGSGQTQVFTSGPGVYQISVTPGSDNAHWSIEVEDDY